jgi:hypothetical protein
MLTNCKNCGAPLNGNCEYCGTKYLQPPCFFYDPLVINPLDLAKPMIPVNIPPKQSIWESIAHGAAMAISPPRLWW